MSLSSFTFGQVLGEGSFSTVKLCKHKITGARCAVKIFDKNKLVHIDSNMIDNIRTEIEILANFKHPHITRLYLVMETESEIFTVMEYVSGGDLFDYIVERSHLGEAEGRLLFQQIISGLEYCHVNMVVHRDLKPENLLVNANQSIQIADFGLSSKMVDGNFLKTSCGSPNYAAPEVISGDLYCGPEVDVWSAGVTLFAMLAGYLPFESENVSSLYKQITSGKFDIPTTLSPGAHDILRRILYTDPLKRATIEDIRNHPWFLQDIPEYLKVSGKKRMADSLVINEHVLQECVELGFVRDQVIAALHIGPSLLIDSKMFKFVELREMALSYHILLAKRIRASIEPVATMPFKSMPSCSDLESLARSESVLQNLSLMSHDKSDLSKDKAHDISNVTTHTHNPCTVQPKLGMFTFRSRNVKIFMSALLECLLFLNFDWKFLDLYEIRARYPAQCVQNNGQMALAQDVIKMHLVLYQVSKNKDGSTFFALDVQRLYGQTFLFFNTTQSLFDILRTRIIDENL